MDKQINQVLKGIPAAPGLAHGRMILVDPPELDIPQFQVGDPEAESIRLLDACEKGKHELAVLKEDVGERSKSNESQIFEAHRMILEDVALLDRAKKAISQGCNAEKAWMDAIEFFAKMMADIPDETLSSRALDIRDVGRRVLGHLLGVKAESTELTEPSVIVGYDLTPSDTVSLDKDLVLAFCTAAGGPTSHTAILAKAFGLPAVVGLGEALMNLPEGTLMLVDGDAGEVVIHPDAERKENFIEAEAKAEAIRKKARQEAQAPAVTAEGDRVEIVANIGGVEDAPLGIKNGAEGVGLFRTEFLYLDRSALPSEADQVDVYRKVFAHYQDMPVVVRTLDIGGDKVIPYLDLPKELNPFLGWRGIRMCEGAEDIFLQQFRALLRAGVGVDLRIMVPMVSGIEEIRAARAIMTEAEMQLRAESEDYNADVQFGIMIEVPSAALLADRLAKEIDFFSIGTNDLTQYTLAVDRTNSKVAHLASPFNPAVLSLIQQTIAAAHAEGKWVGLCGELAGEALAAPILLGLELDEFSMSPARVPVIKRVMRHLKSEDCQSLAKKVLRLSTAEDVKSLARSFLDDLGLTL